MSGDTSTDYESHRSSQKIIKTVATLLSEIINENKEEFKNSKETGKIPSNIDKHKSIFNSKKPPSISIQQYIERIVKYSKMEDSTLIITLIYIDRLCDMSQLHLNDFNIHRIILATVLIAIKYNEDDYFSNDYYAKVGGISLQEINTLEYECVKLMNHRLFVDEEFYKKYELYLKQYQK
jgi:hypothetical protein